jgi:glycosyltransferase involved in cell wall biosynthesis
VSRKTQEESPEDMQEQRPLVSIVTPAHNEEEHLAECLESVLAQTYAQWECTIVNNCSTDKTLAIAGQFAAKDARFRVLSHSKLLPALTNFNFALQQISAASKYCKMILADDWMFPECLERMVKIMEDHPSVGIVGAYGLEGQWVLWEGIPYPGEIVSGRDICRQRLLGGPYVFGSQSSILVRSDLVRSRVPFYSESTEHPDSEVCFELLKDCDFGFVHQVLTFSRVRSGSLLDTSRQLNTLAPSILHELLVYGRHYLTAEEYEKRLKKLLSEYYEFLASSFFERQPKPFWDYHRKRMREEGIGFSRARLASTVGGRLLKRFSLSRKSAGTRQWGL